MAKSSRIKRRALAKSKNVRTGRRLNGFNLAVGAIIVVGLTLVLISREPNGAGAVGPYLNNPKTGTADHWHAAVGVNICGKWQPGPLWTNTTPQGSLSRAKQPNVYAGMHTHTLADGKSDGLIHMEPASAEESGRHATLGRWIEYGGWKLDSSSFELWTGEDGQPIKKKNGDKCGDKAGEVRWAVGQNKGKDADGKQKKVDLQERTGNPDDLKLFDEDVVAIYFVPKDAKLSEYGNPPSVENLANPLAGEGSGHSNVTTTSTPGATTTTVAGATTTTAAGATTTTAAGATTTTAAAAPSTTAAP